VISRFVDKQHATGSDHLKGVFQSMMFRQAAFAGVEILTFCLMGNHFHILLRVPERPAELPEDHVLNRVSHIWSPAKLAELKERFAHLRDTHADPEPRIDAELERFRARMFDLSQYVKDLKQRFCQWYNRTQDRKGTLFESRFKSVLVQDGRALRFMAAYIDLNPLRAGLVEDPVDYPHCGYAQAMAGNRDRRRGIRRVMADPRDPNGLARIRKARWKDVARRYRLWLFERGVRTSDPSGTPAKPGFSRKQAIEAWCGGGCDLPPAKLLRCKSRYLTDCLIFGSESFIAELIATLSGQIDRKHAKPRPNASGLCGLTPLRGNPVE